MRYQFGGWDTGFLVGGVNGRGLTEGGRGSGHRRRRTGWKRSVERRRNGRRRQAGSEGKGVEEHRSLGGIIISRLDNGAFVGLIYKLLVFS